MKISAVILASGLSKRFGENKLLYNFNGKSLIENIFGEIKGSKISEVVVVTKYDEIITLSQKCGIDYIKNEDTTGDLSKTIRLGVEKFKNSDGIMLCVGDQPFLKRQTIDKLCLSFTEDKEKIYSLSFNGEMGNPVIFPKRFFNDLLTLPPFSRGKKVVLDHKESLKLVEISDGRELEDIDEKF